MWKNRKECCIIEMRYNAHEKPTAFSDSFCGKRKDDFIMVKKKEKDENIERFCAFCEFANSLPTADGADDDMICEKKGVVRADHVCRKFRYDLLKRAPKDKPRLGEFQAVSLED